MKTSLIALTLATSTLLAACSSETTDTALEPAPTASQTPEASSTTATSPTQSNEATGTATRSSTTTSKTAPPATTKTTEQPAGQQTPSSGATATNTSGEADGEGTPAGVETLAFGSTFSWDDGVQISIGQPQPFTASAMAYPENAKGVKMQVTITNGSSKPFESYMMFLQATSGDKQAIEIVDPEANIDAPTDDILPGESLTYTTAFATPGGDLIVSAQKNGDATGYFAAQ